MQLQNGTTAINKTKAGSTIDVTRKSQIVVVKGTRAAQQAALIALRAELAEMTENISFTVSNSKKEESKPSKHFVFRWIAKD